MPSQYTENVVQTLATHLGVSAHEIAPTHDLYRDWGLTPLALVVVLLDLERSASIELACEEFSHVRTVADLVSQFRASLREGERASNVITFRKARSSRSARKERRLRRELHHLRWLEQNLQRRTLGAARPGEARRLGAVRRVAGR
ncbi:MAG TPA: phosphopantetheine-binding protein [Polyangiaceae bacterium]|nr:phosphopantetheine-binding protein [Polyangiaceae bacterium]